MGTGGREQRVQEQMEQNQGWKLRDKSNDQLIQQNMKRAGTRAEVKESIK
jgi:hypothetical protein